MKTILYRDMSKITYWFSSNTFRKVCRSSIVNHLFGFYRKILNGYQSQWYTFIERFPPQMGSKRPQRYAFLIRNLFLDIWSAKILNVEQLRGKNLCSDVNHWNRYKEVLMRNLSCVWHFMVYILDMRYYCAIWSIIIGFYSSRTTSLYVFPYNEKNSQCIDL